MLKLRDEKQRMEVREKIWNAAKQMILADDYKALERLYSRLACRPTWSEMQYDNIVFAAASCSDAELLAALQFVQHADAMSEAGLKADGSR